MSVNSANSANSTFISSNSNMNATVSELKKIVDALVASNLTKSKEQILQEYNVPKVYIKGGKPTKKALDLNKRLIREGLTYDYLDKTKFVDRTLDKTGNVRVYIKDKKFDKRFVTKQVPIKSQKDLRKIGDIKLKQDLRIKNDKKYITSLKKQIKSKSSLNKGIVNVDLTKANLATVLDIVRDNSKGINEEGKTFTRKIVGQSSNSKNWITFSSQNITKLKDFESISGADYESRVGSDNQFILELQNKPTLKLMFNPVEVTKKKEKPQGAFFKYYHTLQDDFSRYDIFSEKPVNYKNNCLYNALEGLDCDEDKLNDLRTFVRCGNVPLSKLNEICNRMEICIHLRKENGVGNLVSTYYGKEFEDDELYELALLDQHFFIFEKTNVTKYYLNNYDEVKDLPNPQKIYKCSKGKYGRSSDRFINSMELVRTILKSENLKVPIPTEDIMDTQYVNDMIDNDNLEYDEEKCCEVNEQIKTDRAGNPVIYFDFETDTTGEKHIPYLMCATSTIGKSCSFTGKYCGTDFTNWIKINFKQFENVIIIAHNLRYDYTFIMDNLFCLKPILKTNRIMGGTGRLYYGDKKYIELGFLDSCNLINTKLSSFGKMFNLEQKKEILPYSLYTTENIEDRHIPLETCLDELNCDSDKEEYLKNCEKWNCIDYGDDAKFVDIIEYSRRYCEMDCIVLQKGFETFRGWINEVTGLDTLNYCSIASLGLDYIVSRGCLEDCYKISGRPREFIQRAVVGGRCMSNSNKKWWVKGKKVADFDAVSLYPSAMNRMEGILKGKPKVIENKSFDWLQNNTDGFFVKVLCKNNPTKNLGFPLLSSQEGEVRQFSNETKNNIYYLDKTLYEECVKHQGLDFEIICGYYYDEGRNNTINSVIEHLFKARLEAKKNKNPIQAIYKLLMNSCYGKCLLKPIDSDTEIVPKSRWDDYLEYHYNYIKSMVELDKVWIVSKIKTINSHFNNVYAGVEILSMSKRIMNEVMCLGEELGHNIYYTDTDSIHIDANQIALLSEEYKKRHNRELIGKNLGQFHTDFDLDGADKDIIATESIFLGKKCYIDRLEGLSEDNKKVFGHHIRMKGVSGKAIDHYSKTYNIDVMDIYRDLYNEDTLPEDRKFDLLAGGEAVKFQYNPDMSVSNVGEFKRGVNFKYDKGDLSSGVIVV